MKKKILLLSTFIIAALVILCTGNKKEVKAEECPVYYNYYLFLDGTKKVYMESLIKTNDPYHYYTGKDFNLGVPEEAKEVNGGSVDFVENEQESNETKWTVGQFYDIFTSKALGTGEVSTYDKNNTGNKSYARAYLWKNEAGESQTGVQDPPKNKTDFLAGVPKFEGNPTFTIDNIGRTGIDSKSSFRIERKWSSAAIGALDDSVEIVFSPAVYYVSYQLCEEETPTYTLTVEHLLDDETNKKLKDNFVDTKKYKTGEDYEYNCPAIDGYTVVNSSNKPSTVDGTFEDKDITRQCYYTEEEKTYTLTINYGDSDADCSKLIGTSKTYEGLKEGENKKHEVPKEISSLVNPKLGNISTEKATVTLSGTDLSVTMPDKNVSVCIVYTGQYGVSWIYLVWVIGGLALGYSIWYFVRYYKKQNSEI